MFCSIAVKYSLRYVYVSLCDFCVFRSATHVSARFQETSLQLCPALARVTGGLALIYGCADGESWRGEGSSSPNARVGALYEPV